MGGRKKQTEAQSRSRVQPGKKMEVGELRLEFDAGEKPTHRAIVGERKKGIQDMSKKRDKKADLAIAKRLLSYTSLFVKMSRKRCLDRSSR